ncbi:ATP-binding protein [Acaryochloris sp. 'Moss Beach']|uniref:AlbA family DNA-binding domain-containing protein n=1 Tax=Acaryochloris sp. 'Moss Beach' TaxID=2740837 RepID=UPI001F486473|nr:ATP-binding protein [Acaryochloris sp. 'Moss Beach']UJB69560.1 ATP-binding protein [Acaryochloris sp. 'Moss Beach']
MKQPHEWTEEDILSLIANKIEESIDLDYKECRALENTPSKKKEIGKDVSAFANSAGGTIVYGIKEEGHLPTSIDVGFDPKVISKEWLDQVINSNIKPKVEGVIINPIELLTTKPGKYVYVVNIPQALSRAPHQASDKRYYKRYNSTSLAIEDYEVRDLFSRQSIPDLFLEFFSYKRSL